MPYRAHQSWTEPYEKSISVASFLEAVFSGHDSGREARPRGPRQYVPLRRSGQSWVVLIGNAVGSRTGSAEEPVLLTDVLQRISERRAGNLDETIQRLVQFEDKYDGSG